MENNSNPLWKSTMNSGAILGLVLVIYSIILYTLDFTEVKGLAYISYIVFISGLYWGTKSYRDKYLGGFISYSNALGAGVLVSVFAGLLIGFYQIIFMTFINPEFFEKIIEASVEGYINAGYSDDQIEQSIKVLEYFRKPIVFGILIVIVYTFFGFIVSLITSIFMKKETDSFKDAMKDIE